MRNLKYFLGLGVACPLLLLNSLNSKAEELNLSMTCTDVDSSGLVYSFYGDATGFATGQLRSKGEAKIYAQQGSEFPVHVASQYQFNPWTGYHQINFTYEGKQHRIEYNDNSVSEGKFSTEMLIIYYAETPKLNCQIEN